MSFLLVLVADGLDLLLHFVADFFVDFASCDHFLNCTLFGFGFLLFGRVDEAHLFLDLLLRLFVILLFGCHLLFEFVDFLEIGNEEVEEIPLEVLLGNFLRDEGTVLKFDKQLFK
jgi:hypothetical protein